MQLSTLVEFFGVEPDVYNLVVYRSQYAGTNKATALNWLVGKDIESIARGLKERGVTFEYYEIPGMTHEGDLHVMGNFKTAWFKDPDGNMGTSSAL